MPKTPVAFAVAILLSGSALAQMPGPFAAPSTLPYQAPPFDRIKDSDYQPALEAGMAEQLAEIARIAADPTAPTFANTLVAIERSGALLSRARLAFFAVAQANTNPTLQRVRAATAPKLAAHDDAIFQNGRLFARVKAIHDGPEAARLNPEQRMLVDVYYQNFQRAGAQLGAADQAALRDINKRLSSDTTEFLRRLTAATTAGALVVDDPARLAGLGAAGIATAAATAKDRGLAGKYVLPLQNTTTQPALQSLADRATRQALFEASWTRTEHGDANDTRALLLEIVTLRARKAKLLGYASWADYVLADQMAKTPAAAKAFMAQLGPPTAAAQRREAAEIRKAMAGDAAVGGGGAALEPWDWAHYAEQVRKARYDLDEEQLKPFFEIDKVLVDGVFYAANQLYGLTFKERHDLPTYVPDMRVFEVFEESGKPLGLMYFDYWKRDNKAGGAWNSSFVRNARLLGTMHVGYNVANFTKPAAGQPQLITSDDVVTMFHEFGHALHGLFGTATYPRLVPVARDFAEYPSQFNEHWAWEPRILAHYAVHYRTGAVIPKALVDRIKRAETFNQGHDEGALLAAAQLDMAWHSLGPDAIPSDVDAFEARALAATKLEIGLVPPRYRSSYFAHIFEGGYSAGYYAYIWTDMLEENSYAWMQAHGGMTRANGQRFRDTVLSRARTQDYGAMFRNMVGHDPDIAPLLKSRGLAAGG